MIENTLTKIANIEQMQIVQDDLDIIQLSIVPGNGYGRSQAVQLENCFKGIFGSDIQIDLQEVSEIKPEKSGKYRFSICRVTTQ